VRPIARVERGAKEIASLPDTPAWEGVRPEGAAGARSSDASPARAGAAAAATATRRGDHDGTPPPDERFTEDFELHSALSDGERYDAWLALRSGARRIAVGARSGCASA